VKASSKLDFVFLKKVLMAKGGIDAEGGKERAKIC